MSEMIYVPIQKANNYFNVTVNIMADITIQYDSV